MYKKPMNKLCSLEFKEEEKEKNKIKIKIIYFKY
jgi:hypothetical protein